MAERKEKSSSKIPQGSARETPSSLPKGAVGRSKKTDEGGSSTVTKVLHIVDVLDGTKWRIEDSILIGLLKEYKSAPDQRTKDDILKRLEERIAFLNSEEEANQIEKNLPKGGAIGAKIEEREQGNLTKDLQKLKLDTDSQAGKAKQVDKSTKKNDSEITHKTSERAAFLNIKAEANQTKKNLPKGGAIGAKIGERQQSKLTKDLQKLKLGIDSQAGKAKQVDKSIKKK